MSAADVPEVFDLVRQVESLRRDLDGLLPRVAAEEKLFEQYRSDVAALHHLITEIGALASQDRV